ncbi:MAG TPA: glycosyltransferase [Chitinophagaceae bacterium]|nr:glycosyltransferase [Chitinophagaceae bacterium]
MDFSFLQNIYWEQLVFYAFAAVIALQLFYYLWFFSRLAFYIPKPKTKSQQHPVSVIVCARDEDENLARHLPGLLVQQYPSTFEVIAVNDNSVDDSKYILLELKKTFKDKLEIIELTQEAKLITGKKFPLSMGIKEAHHEILLLTDADCVPASEFWLQKMQDAYTDGVELVLGYGAYYKRPGLLNKLIRFETFHTALQYLSFAMAGIPYMGVGRNLSYKRTLFFRHKGFSSINHIPGGDDDLFVNKAANKKNTAVVIDKEAITLSRPKKTWKEWHGQKIRHFSTAKYYKPLHKFLLGLYATTQFLLYPLLIVSAIFYSWKLSLMVYGFRLLLLGIIYFFSMKKLNEKDLWPLFIFFDIWMFFYYFIFASSLWNKPQKTW